jgi:hypothetical protein
MSRSHLATCLLGLSILVASAAEADAQQLTRSGMRARPALITEEHISGAMARADGFAQDGQWFDARREYREAASLQRRVRETPEAALRQVAATHYAEGDLVNAARSLDELAALPSVQHDQNARARALIDAAFLYRAAGQRERPREIQRELRQLAKSGALDSALTDEVAKRMR